MQCPLLYHRACLAVLQTDRNALPCTNTQDANAYRQAAAVAVSSDLKHNIHCSESSRMHRHRQSPKLLGTHLDGYGD